MDKGTHLGAKQKKIPTPDEKAYDRMIMVIVIAVVMTIFYILFDYEQSMRALMLVTAGFCVAFSSILMQTVTSNRILTPGVMGLESISVFVISISNFTTALGAMVLFVLFALKKVLEKEERNIYFLLLLGAIITIIFSGINYEQNASNDMVLFASIVAIIMFALSYKNLKHLDMLSLGRENAISFGLNYNKLSGEFLAVIGVLVVISVYLIGPIVFFGVIASNITYQLIKTYKHKYILPTSICISIITLLFLDLVVNQTLELAVGFARVINFVGGIYFMLLLIKSERI